MSYTRLSARQMGSALIAIAAVSLASCGGGSAPTTSTPIPDPTPPEPQATSFLELSGGKQFMQVQASGGKLQWWSNFGFDGTLSRTTGKVGYGVGGDYEFSLADSGDGMLFLTELNFDETARVASKSDNRFSVYSIPNAEIALLEPGDDASGYVYTSMALLTETKSSSLKYSALTFGFPTVGSDLPSTGSAAYGGAMVGSAYLRETSYESADIGVLDGPAELTVDFGTEAMSIHFGGLTSSSVTDNIRYRSLITGEERTFPDIGFSDISLTRNLNEFTSDQPFLAGIDVLVITDPVMKQTGRLQGAFYGPVSDGAPPEVGGSAYVDSPAFSVALGFVAKKDGEPESFDFDGISPKFIALEGALTGSGGGTAPASVPANFITAADLDTKLTLPSTLYVASNLSPANLPGQYIADNSSAGELAFSIPSIIDIPQIVVVDTQDRDRFGLAVPRFIQAAAVEAPHAMPQSPVGLDIQFNYAVFGEGIPAPDLPVTGIAHFSGTAEGKLVSELPQDSSPLSGRVFDFQSDMVLDIDFARLTAAARLYGYQWPADLRHVIDPQFATEIGLEAPLDRSHNLFASRGETANVQGRLYSGADGDLEAAGIFDVNLTPTMHGADDQKVALTGMFGGGLDDISITGDPPAVPGDTAAGMMDSLFAATDGLAGTGTPALLDVLTNLVVYGADPIASSSYAIAGTDAAVYSGGLEFARGELKHEVVPVGAGDISYTVDAGDITSTSRVAFSVNAGTLAAARQSGHFVVLEGTTQTGGDIYLALAKPGSVLAAMDYTSFGAWAAEEPTKAFSYGFNVLGDPVDPPTSGAASYVGNVIGLAASTSYADGDFHPATGEVGTVLGRSNVDVDFATSAVDITFDQMNYTLPDGAAYDLEDMTFSGEIDEEGQFLADGAIGSFFGPGAVPEEVAGVWNRSFRSPADPDAELRATGVFNGKRQ